MTSRDGKANLKAIGWLAALGGTLTILLDSAVRFLLSDLGYWNVSVPWFAIFQTPMWLTLDFLSGAITVGLLAPFFLNRLERSVQEHRQLLVLGGTIGGIAGFLNSVILATIHLSLIGTFGLDNEVPIARLLGTYMPIIMVIIGLPMGVVCSLIGVAGGLVLPRLFVARRN